MSDKSERRQVRRIFADRDVVSRRGVDDRGVVEGKGEGDRPEEAP